MGDIFQLAVLELVRKAAWKGTEIHCGPPTISDLKQENRTAIETSLALSASSFLSQSGEVREFNLADRPLLMWLTYTVGFSRLSQPQVCRSTSVNKGRFLRIAPWQCRSSSAKQQGETP